MATNTAIFNQDDEIMLASLALSESASEIALIPLITGDKLDNEELVMIYKDFEIETKEDGRDLRIWLLDSQFFGLNNDESGSERVRLLELGVLHKND